MRFFLSTLFTLNVLIIIPSQAMNLTLSPSEFLNRSNSSVISSYIYLKHHYKMIKSDCAIELHNAVKAITQNKEFEQLYADHPIVADQNHRILKGHDHIANALYHDNQIEYHQIESTVNDQSEYMAFKEKELPEEYLDWLIYEYIKLKSECFICVIAEQDIAVQKNILDSIELLGGGIVYQKTIILKNFGFNILKKSLAYTNLTDKKIPPQKFTVYVIEPKVGRSFQTVQTKICNFLMQITDLYSSKNRSEATILAQLVFNKNSLHHANYSHDRELPKFTQLFTLYSRGVVEPEDCCVDNSSVLAAYGIREPGDLDYIHHGVANKKLSRKIESHNWFYNGRYTKLVIDDIIYNPSYHFYYGSQKCMSLDLITSIKSKKRASKDIRDLRLISQHLEKF